MKDETRQDTDLRDKDEAAEQRPVPSQAEGDLQTIEDDLKQKEGQGKQGDASSGDRGERNP
jgi:hypothetical protein